MMVEQNKWRATRYGSAAALVNNDDYKQYTVGETTDRLIELLTPMAERLDCVDELKSVSGLVESTGAQQQLEIFERTNSPQEVVREMLLRNDWRQF